ncbi:hypothetical protein TDB9533_04082 [Thalassocella blandensis]|nr:hypothetical protein TDB9533_04082 [Thalassocella blandensis]
MKDYASADQASPNGFTLIDLMIALSILMLSISIGVPSLNQSLKRSEARALQRTVSSALQFGRTYSLNSGKITTVCGINQHYQCVRNGFKEIAAFIDHNKNGQIDPDENPLLVNEIQYQGQLKLGASGNKTFISFDYRGFSKQAGSFIYCDPQYPALSGRVTISLPGRIYIATDRDSDGIVKLVNGGNIEC